ncbi:Asp-tRNA(Asn)/Glu-tRNA(Gln) amidotransferase subunit GatA [Tahibacter sp.]|uniref:Asp-tRNA(Asn)/Glu-tRNA(Gln) amidotransferase subunit GatA n=1 Tax=Tahibacter sp. TaxID=2056211 RepID=UPI0028C47203|nr:Asp-tRNA(Asn)/Glu-tRNA(Gln) amidotransferase subunit GatA [Tahibacter sp.]
MSTASIAALAADLAVGRTSAVQLAEQSLQRADAQRALNSFIRLDADAALAAARTVDADRAAGREMHPLAGIPFAHKDIFCTKGITTTCGSRMLQHFVPPYDALVVERLARAGAVSIGKTNMDEFAMGSSNENSAYGAAINPWGSARVPGGSSGGSAAAVAAGIVPFATGTDTGGSIRQPAAFCGITGLKPTYGRVSRYGMIAYASSLDCAGVLARSATDCATVFDQITGFDPRDSTSVDRPADRTADALGQPLAGLRIGVAREYFGGGVHDDVAARTHAALRELEMQGAQLVDITLPSAHHAIAAYYVIAPAEASSNLARYDGVRYGHRSMDARSLDELYSRSRAEGFGSEVQRRILVGTYALSAGYYDAYYLRAQKVRRLIANDFLGAFGSVDLIAGPTAPTTAFRLGEKSGDALAMYAADVNTVAVNLAGLPAISVPAGFAADGLPVGLQLIAPAFAEARLLNAAHQLQRVTDWHLQEPAA